MGLPMVPRGAPLVRARLPKDSRGVYHGSPWDTMGYIVGPHRPHGGFPVGIGNKHNTINHWRCHYRGLGYGNGTVLIHSWEIDNNNNNRVNKVYCVGTRYTRYYSLAKVGPALVCNTRTYLVRSRRVSASHQQGGGIYLYEIIRSTWHTIIVAGIV